MIIYSVYYRQIGKVLSNTNKKKRGNQNDVQQEAQRDEAGSH
jgi:hypothetical protein